MPVPANHAPNEVIRSADMNAVSALLNATEQAAQAAPADATTKANAAQAAAIAAAAADATTKANAARDAAIAADAVTSVAGRTGTVTLAKADVGLSNVDNTSDANKPVSMAQTAALAAKLDTTAANSTYLSKAALRKVLAADFGVVADGRRAGDGSISSTNFGAGAGAPVVRSTQIAFTSADVGKTLMTVTDYNSGFANSSTVSVAIPVDSVLSAVPTITLTTPLTVALASGSPVWLMIHGVRHYTTTSAAHAVGATVINVNTWQVDLFGVTTFTAAAPVAGARNAAWVMFPVSTTVLGTIASVSGTDATMTSGSAPVVSASNLTLFVGTDYTTQLAAAVAEAERSYASTSADNRGSGGIVELPRGIVMTTGEVLFNGARLYANVANGGVGLFGQGKRATTLVCASLGQAGITFGVANSTTGSTAATVSDVQIGSLTLQGPGMMFDGTVGLDKRVSGGGYTYSDVLVDSFGIGIRHHDMYTLVASGVETHRCRIGRAIGYQGDIHQWNSPYANHCLIDLYVGYTDPARSQVQGTNIWRAHAEIGAVATGCYTNIYIEGLNTSSSFTTIERHNEFFADRALRVGDGGQKKAVLGRVKHDGVDFNALRPIADIFGPAGRVQHAVDVNWAFSVELDGCQVNQTSDAPVSILAQQAGVSARFASTSYNGTDAVLGDVRYPDGIYRYATPPTASPYVGNAAQKTPIVYGRWAASPTPDVYGLPGAVQLSSGAWLNRDVILTTDGRRYRCENVAGVPTWVAVSTATDLAAAVSGPGKYVALSQVVLTNDVTLTTLDTYTIPASTIKAGTTYRIRAGGTIENVGTNSGTLTFRLRLAGTTILTFTVPASSTASTTGRFSLSGTVTFRQTGGSSTCGFEGQASIKFGGATATYADASAALTVTTAVANDLLLTAQWATADVANILRREVTIVEKVA